MLALCYFSVAIVWPSFEIIWIEPSFMPYAEHWLLTLIPHKATKDPEASNLFELTKFIF